MQLFNADGSRSEMSGNGVRCLAAWIASTQELEAGHVHRHRDRCRCEALELLGSGAGRYTFCAAMGQPEQIDTGRHRRRRRSASRPSRCASGTRSASCSERSPKNGCTRSAAALAVHPHFPEGTNVELAAVEAPDRVRILIWERGVGPTEASGTGACAAAVAAIQYGHAARDVQVVVARRGAARRVGR